MKEISLDRGASPLGYSALTRRQECARAARLAEAKAQEAGAVSRPVGDKSLAVGLMLHKLLELAELGEPVDEADIFMSGGAPVEREWVDEAWRLYNAYRMTPGLLGTTSTVAVEYEIKPTADLVEILGAPVTGYIDRVFEVKSEEQVEAVRRARGVELEVGKVYLQDYKTEFRDDGDKMFLRHRYSMQFALYQVAWNILNPGRLCAGVLVDCIVKNKVPKFVSYLLPPVSEDEVWATIGWVRNVMRVYEESLGAANPSACVNRYGRLCPYRGIECFGY